MPENNENDYWTYEVKVFDRKENKVSVDELCIKSDDEECIVCEHSTHSATFKVPSEEKSYEIDIKDSKYTFTVSSGYLWKDGQVSKCYVWKDGKDTRCRVE